MGKRETELFLSPLPYLYQFDPFCFKKFPNLHERISF